jgi:hypothetical protein
MPNLKTGPLAVARWHTGLPVCAAGDAEQRQALADGGIIQGHQHTVEGAAPSLVSGWLGVGRTDVAHLIFGPVNTSLRKPRTTWAASSVARLPLQLSAARASRPSSVMR